MYLYTYIHIHMDTHGLVPKFAQLVLLPARLEDWNRCCGLHRGHFRHEAAARGAASAKRPERSTGEPRRATPNTETDVTGNLPVRFHQETGFSPFFLQEELDLSDSRHQVSFFFTGAMAMWERR